MSNSVENQTPLTREQQIYALKVLIEELRSKFDTKILLKTQTRLMRFIGRVMFFNKEFMDSYVTTMFGNLYFPESWREIVELVNEDPNLLHSRPDLGMELKGLLSILFHEYVHLNDDKNSFLRTFSVKYLTPQIYSVFGLASLVAGFFDPWYFFGTPALVYALPMGSYYRSYYEARGYATNVVCLRLIYGVHSINTYAFEKYFTSSAYYWMAGTKFERKIFKDRMLKMVRDRLLAAELSLADERVKEHYDELEHVYRIINKARSEA